MKKRLAAFLLLGAFLLSRGAVASLPSRYYRFERLLPEVGGAPVTGISSILQDREGYLWFGTIAGLTRYDGRRFLFFSPPSGPTAADPSRTTVVFPAIEDSRGDIWIGTSWSGLGIWDRKTGEYFIIKHDSQDADSLDDDNITSIFKDTSGIMWVGTTRGGINKCLADQVKFPHFKRNRYDNRSISRNEVRSL